MTTDYTLTTKAVNSKRLLDLVTQVEIIFTDFDIMWSSDAQRLAAIDTINDMMAQLWEDGKITQWKVISDYRNNTIAQMSAGIYFLTITYRQAHCLNTTILDYKVETDDTELELDFEF